MTHGDISWNEEVKLRTLESGSGKQLRQARYSVEDSGL
jgi:hypothetical protein